MNRYISLGTMSLASMVLAASCSAGKDGLEGKASLVRLDNETAGANCANGGTAIKSGIDANGDGQLNDDEVNASYTRYFCTGAKGPTGDDYQLRKALSLATPVSPGEKCARGGYLLQTGVDDNDNGQLDDGEIDSSQYVCMQNPVSEILFGDITVRSAEDLKQLEGIRVIIGSLQILDGVAETLRLPDLQTVSGQVIFGDFNGPPPNPIPGEIHTTKLELPALKTAAFAVFFPELTSFSAPVLENSYGTFGFVGTKLMQVSLPKLTTSYMLAFLANADLADVQAPELTGNVGAIQVQGGTADLTFSVPKVQHVDQLEFQASTLKELTFPQLETIGRFHLTGNAALTAVHLPKLTVATDVQISNNAVLTTLDFPALEQIEGSANANPQLSECFIAELNAQLYQAGRSQFLSDNGGNKAEQCDPAKVCISVQVGSVADRYRQCTVTRTFNDARTICQGLATGTDLVVFEDYNEWLQMSAATSGHVIISGSWIGYTDAAVENSWTWVTGVTGYQPGFSTAFWNGGEPNNVGEEDCAQLTSNGRVNDSQCTGRGFFICEANPVVTPP